MNGDNTQRGLMNQMFGVFIFLSIFPQLVNQIMPVFALQRVMYEARERPSKTYSWKAFLTANIVVELAWNSVSEILSADEMNKSNMTAAHVGFRLRLLVLPHWSV